MSVENKKWGGKFKIAARNETIIKKYYGIITFRRKIHYPIYL